MKVINFIILVLLVSCAHKKSKEETVTGVIESRNRQFQQCHIESDSHKQAGKVRMKALLNKKGAVRDSYIIDSTFNDPNLHACLEGILSPLEFPSGYADEIDIPLSFQSGQI